jgi:hypothetical protein
MFCLMQCIFHSFLYCLLLSFLLSTYYHFMWSVSALLLFYKEFVTSFHPFLVSVHDVVLKKCI